MLDFVCFVLLLTILPLINLINRFSRRHFCLTGIPTISGPSSFYTIATINADGDEPTDLQCAFSPFDASITVKWLHINTCNESRFIEMSDNLKYAGSNATHPSLVIYNVDARDLGRYWCQVTNLHGTISAYEIKLEKSGDYLL